MKKQSWLNYTFVGVLVLTIGILPAAAFARDDDNSGSHATGTAVIHVETSDGEEISVGATTTEGTHAEDVDENESDNADNADNNDQGKEASSTRHGQDNEHRDTTPRHESDSDDEDAGEIEIDHDSADNATTTIDAPEHVSNRGELRSFLNHVIKEDDRIADVHVSSTTIETHYEMPAKFLWTIPVNLTAEVSVKNDGSVSITYPWYAFLFAKHRGDIETQLEQSVASTSSTTFSANTQAHLLNLLFLTLKNSAGQ